MDYRRRATLRAPVHESTARLGLPVVPVRVDGLHHILHHSWKWPRSGRATVRFGPPILLSGNEYKALAAQVEAAVRGLLSLIVAAGMWHNL